MTKIVLGVCYDLCVRFAQFPAYVLDMLDREGKPDHGKIVPFLLVQEILVLIWFGKLPITAVAVSLVTVLIAAVFGNSMFRSFLRSKKPEEA